MIKEKDFLEALNTIKQYNLQLQKPIVRGMLKCYSCGYEYEELIIAKDGNMKCKDCAL